MYYKEETLFEQYPLELTDTYKGRGAVFAMTDIGRVYLKEYSGSAVKAEFLAKLLECVNEQGIHTETVVRTTEGRTTVAYIREAYQRASDGQKLYQRAEKQERI